VFFFSLKSGAEIDRFENPQEAIKYAITKSRPNLLKEYLSDINLTDYERKSFLTLAVTMLDLRKDKLLSAKAQAANALTQLGKYKYKKYSKGEPYRAGSVLLGCLGLYVFILSELVLAALDLESNYSYNKTEYDVIINKAFWTNTIVTPLLLISGVKKLWDMAKEADEDFIKNHYRSPKTKYLDSVQVYSILQLMNNA